MNLLIDAWFLSAWWVLSFEHSLFVNWIFCTADRPNMNQYSQARRHLGLWLPIIDSWPVQTSWTCSNIWMNSHSPGVFLIFHLFLAQNGLFQNYHLFVGVVNSRQLIPSHVTYWEVTHPEKGTLVGTNISHPKGIFLSNLLEQLLVFPKQGIRLS